MKTLLTAAVLAGAASLTLADNIDHGIFFGSGNSNGNFTVNTGSGVELGLRAKIPFVGTTNFDGDHTYTYAAGEVWNFDWSVNSDVDNDNPTGNNLSAFTYELSMFKVNADGNTDADALTFDLINPSFFFPFFDHSIGDNDTTQATDTIAGDPVTYAALIAANNVAQNSWKYDFFNFPGTAIEDYDVNTLGTYIVRLTAFDRASGLAVVSTDININVVPVPTAAFAGLGLLGLLGGVRVLRRR